MVRGCVCYIARRVTLNLFNIPAVAAVARNASTYAWRRLKQVLVCSAAQAAAAVAASHGVLGPGGCGTPPPTGTLPVSEDTSP